MDIENSELNISNSFFYNNTASILRMQNSQVYIIKSRVTTHAAGLNTDELNNLPTLMLSQSSLTITDSIFTNMVSSNPAILNGIESQVSIENSLFIDSTSQESLIKLQKASELRVNNSSFTGNTGTAISVTKESTGVVTNSIFSGNQGNSGGCVFAADNTNVTVRNSYFTNNTAIKGGAIFCEEHVILNIWGSKFDGNQAISVGETEMNSVDKESVGGAVVVITFSTVEFIKCEFIGNNAELLGGAVYFGRNFTIHLSVHNNRTQTEEIARFTEINSPYTGENSIGTSNGKSNMVDMMVRESTFVKNSAGHSGGALFVQLRNSMGIINSLFEQNTAQLQGTTLVLIDVTDVNIQNSEFSGTEQVGNEGIHSSGGQSLRIADTLFSFGTKSQMTFTNGDYSLFTLDSKFSDQEQNVLLANDRNFLQDALTTGIIQQDQSANLMQKETPYASRRYP